MDLASVIEHSYYSYSSKVLTVPIHSISSFEIVFKEIEKRFAVKKIKAHLSFEHFEKECESSLIVNKEDREKIYFIHYCSYGLKFSIDGNPESEFFEAFNSKQKSETKKRLRSERCYSLYESGKNLVRSELV